MEHIPVSMSLTGKIDSAPKKFIVFVSDSVSLIFQNNFVKSFHTSETFKILFFCLFDYFLLLTNKNCDFFVQGYFRDQYIPIDTFEYNIQGAPTQTFLITVSLIVK